MNAAADVKKNAGYCCCCRRATEFRSAHAWLRDHYKCSSCNSLPRQRHLQHILDRFFPVWTLKSIHESSPSNDYIARHAGTNYSFSQFFPDVPPGERRNGARCENLEKLTFADETFDIFITQDVMEHVFNPDRAAREIMRVLKSGGAHIFTAPKNRSLRDSRPRAVLKDGAIVHLVEPEYHGNPVGDGRALVTWDYGDDFETLLHQWCGHPTTTYLTRDDSLGLDGEYLEVFVTRKITGRTPAAPR